MQLAILIGSIIVFLWLSVMSFFLIRTRAHYNTLVKKTGQRNLEEMMNLVLSKYEFLEKETKEIKNELTHLNNIQPNYYQKIGFLRFNPFERVAGDQSFIISFLNGENSGIILNFLYTRDGVRIYSKKIKKGLSEDFELSSEEKEVIAKAK